MGYHEFILVINFSCIIILLLLAALLLVATRFRGENGYAAAIIVLPNIPVYIYTMSRMLGWYEVSLFFFPIGYSANTMLMPLLWLFTKRNFDPAFCFKPVQFLHFMPAVLLAIIALAIPVRERMSSILYETAGGDNWVGDSNTIIILIQMVVYFLAIFIYIDKRKRYIKENSSDAEYLQKEWIPRLMLLFAVLFAIVMICYVFWPRTDAWLIQILNVVAMAYLVHNSVAHPAIPNIEEVSGIQDRDNAAVSVLDEMQMKEVSLRVKDYLETTGAFLRTDLSLALLSKETGIPQKQLSRSINGYLRCNYFELINKMRVEEVKRRLLLPENSGYTVDSIYEDCGFRSRSTFFLAFKKVEGKSPAQWLKEMSDISNI